MPDHLFHRESRPSVTSWPGRVFPFPQEYKHLFLLTRIFLFALLINACKESDNVPPTVNISYPGSNFSGTGSKLLSVTGNARDEGGLTQVQASLYTENYSSVVASNSKFIDGVNTDFSIDLPLGTRYTETGQYILKVSAYDQTGNTGSDFVHIQINELPLKTYRTFWEGRNLNNQSTIFLRDSLAAVSTGPAFSNALGGFIVDNKNQQLLTCEENTGELKGWNIDYMGMIWQNSIPVTVPYKGVTAAGREGGTYYLGTDANPFMRVFDATGSGLNTYPDVIHPVTAICTDTMSLFAGLRGIIGTPMKVDRYDIFTRELKVTNNLGWEISWLIRSNSHIAAAGNDLSVNKVVLMDPVSLVTDYEFDITREIRGLCSNENNIYVLTDQGVFRIDGSSGTDYPLFINGNYTSININKETNRIYLGGSDLIDVFSNGGSFIETINGGFGEVHMVEFNYNK